MIATSLIHNLALDGIQRLQQEDIQITTLLSNLNQLGDLILVGGAIRDFAFLKSPRDIDIIIDSEESNFDEAVKRFNYRKNRFGGYKVFLDNVEFDIWGIKHNWAFKEKILDTQFKNISKGTFYNFDALALNISTSDLDADVFVESMKEKVLDITLKDEYIEQNPSPEVNIVRAFIIHKYWGLSFSNKVMNYISNWSNKMDAPVDILRKAELKHYGSNRLIKEDYFIFC
ncbi:hypothetical protein RGU11_20650 [Rossellomorea marisflavi]|uniref:hypothetical protein n=1 Tax=Rossellomorea marisflavi TaxID=189381 RepID=UPI00285367B2|nr:hypothetical protein [Rossellomorea marisflavi]MDR4938796.1 hypothetical protein [Rossellomorea marisflavi]